MRDELRREKVLTESLEERCPTFYRPASGPPISPISYTTTRELKGTSIKKCKMVRGGSHGLNTWSPNRYKTFVIMVK